MNLTVKNIPEPVYRAIKRDAKRKRKSLNARVIESLETDAAEIGRLPRVRSSFAELARFTASLPALPDSTRIIGRARLR